MLRKEISVEGFNQISETKFPGKLGIRVTAIEEGKMSAEMPIQADFFAPNGFLHAGSIVTFADTIAGYSTVAHLPEGAKSFTTLELKSNFIGAAKEGTLYAESTAIHLGRTTHVWNVAVSLKATGKKIAHFSCTQLILK